MAHRTPSALGVFVTFLAFTLTYRQNAKQNKDIQEQNRLIQEQNQVIQEQNISSQKQAEEQIRLQMFPIFAVYERQERVGNSELLFISEQGALTSASRDTFDTFRVSIKNIGAGPAMNIFVTSQVPSAVGVDFGYLASGDILYIDLLMYNLSAVKFFDCILNISYYDIYNRNYIQLVRINKTHDKYTISNAAPPSLFNPS